MADTDPTTQPAADAEPKLEKGETTKPGDSTPTVAEKASAATSAVKDNVFSMFGGGPKKEKKKEEEDVDEPSGSSKAMATKEGAEVRAQIFMVVYLCNDVANYFACRRRKSPKKRQTSTLSL
jgi:Ran-binding protein 1